MREYFIVANSFAAPFVSDESTHFLMADSPADALTNFADHYKHPCGLYSAGVYESADAFHKNAEPLARWLSNHAQTIEQTNPTILLCNGPGDLELDHKRVFVKNPKQGAIV